MIRIAAIALLALGAAGGVSAQSGLSKELTSLQGTWVMTSINGEAVDGSQPELTVTFTDDKYSQSLNGQVTERGTIKLDPSKKPMAIDFVITEGQDANKTQLGVIEIAADSITGKLNTPGVPQRPADFVPAEGCIVFVLKRKGKVPALRGF
jgi:uncharacterized protein (TIGR03067 family)